eukprot:3038117-Amphidinium_carterae.1
MTQLSQLRGVTPCSYNPSRTLTKRSTLVTHIAIYYLVNHQTGRVLTATPHGVAHLSLEVFTNVYPADGVWQSV